LNIILEVKKRIMHKYQELKKPLDKKALKKHPSKSFLTVINPMYVVERLNDVFGLGKWTARYEVVVQDKEPVVKCILTVPDDGIHVEQFGGNNNIDLGDAYKGAATDALTKCASYLGVGMDIYKGLHDDGAEGLEWLPDTKLYEIIKRIESGEKITLATVKQHFKVNKKQAAKIEEALK